MKPSRRRSCLAGLVVWMMASSASAEPRYESVAVETRFKGKDSARIERIEPELERRAVEALGYRGVDVDDASSTTVVFQVLHVAGKENGSEAVSDYGTHIEVLIDGEKVGEQITMCMQKGEAELVGCALSGLPEVMDLLPQEEVQDAAEVVPSPSDAPAQGEDDEVALAPLGPLGVAGVVVAAAGVGLGVAGGVYFARGEVDEGASPYRNKSSDYRPLGIGLLAGGGAAVAVGATLVAVGVIRTKKKQREQSTRLQLDAAPGFAGLRLSGRF